MINSDFTPPLTPGSHEPGLHDEAVDGIVRAGAGAGGAIALAGVATAVVIALWFAFYFLVFVPRASLP